MIPIHKNMKHSKETSGFSRSTGSSPLGCLLPELRRLPCPELFPSRSRLLLSSGSALTRPGDGLVLLMEGLRPTPDLVPPGPGFSTRVIAGDLDRLAEISPRSRSRLRGALLDRPGSPLRADLTGSAFFRRGDWSDLRAWD